MSDEVISHLLRCCQETGVLCIAISDGESEDSPGLPAGPGGVGIRTVCCKVTHYGAAAVVLDALVDAAVGADVVLHCLYGMIQGHVVPVGVAAVSRGKEHQLQVHHV